MSFSCSDPQVILAREKVNICGRVQVDRQRKASTCLGRAQVFFQGSLTRVPKTVGKYGKQYSRESTDGLQKQKQKNKTKPTETALSG